jgi:hypothetical protein
LSVWVPSELVDEFYNLIKKLSLNCLPYDSRTMILQADGTTVNWYLYWFYSVYETKVIKTIKCWDAHGEVLTFKRLNV